tara:strand:- start:56 stop:601 length:546 start_codon:yes stop_codon:yes gene_type:complete
MKKVILVLAMVALTFSMNAQLNYNQWETAHVTDEFGDRTGESVDRLFVKGKFNNSATYGSKLIVKLVDYGDSMILSLYEYGSSPEANIDYDSNYGFINIKRADGSVEKYSGFALKDGGIYFAKTSETMEEIQRSGTKGIKFYEDFNALINSGKKESIKVIINGDDLGGRSSDKYIFTLITR